MEKIIPPSFLLQKYHTENMQKQKFDTWQVQMAWKPPIIQKQGCSKNNLATGKTLLDANLN